MSIINNIIDSAVYALRSKETIFYKEDSDLQKRYNALEKLNKEYPNNNDLINELFIVKKGLEGENEVAYQLKKAHIGMYVLRDVKVKYGDLTAQIDYVIITPFYTYYVECKNLNGNITVNSNGDFVREFIIDGKKVKKGMYSPLRQVEAQREVIRKIWESRIPKIIKIFSSKYFEYYRRVLVVCANQDTILNTSNAPKEIKHNVIRADRLVRKIEYDIAHRGKTDASDSQKSMKETAELYMSLLVDDNVDYYKYYKDKYCNNTLNINECLKEKLILFRKKRSNEMNIPAYYVFTNEELERLIEIMPKTIEELRDKNILSDVKIKTHGEQIINIINSN